MSKITLAPVGNLIDATTAVNTINNNFAAIQTAYDNTLSRNGAQPDQMESTLDMNSNRIINLPAPLTSNEPVRLGDIDLDTTQILNFAQISGTVSPTQLPKPTATTIGGVESYAPVPHQWLNGISTLGVPSSTTINYSDLVGTPPASTTYTISFSTRALAIAANIVSTAQTVILLGWTTSNDEGGGTYVRLTSTPGSIRNWHFQSVDGSYWQLVTNKIYPKQVGAVVDGTTDDSTALQDWVDYSATFGVVAGDQIGTAIVPIATINLASNTCVIGSNIMTIKKTTDTDAPLIYTTGTSNVTFQGINLLTTSGVQSTTSNTIGLTTMNFTVPSGIIGYVPGSNYVQITSTAVPTNYMIAFINSYSGTTLNVTGTTAVGSGTFTSWYVDVYPVNGTLTPVNSGIKVTSCNNVYINKNTVTGRFYDAIDIRNTSNCWVQDNSVAQYVNRGIAAQAYAVLMTNVVITGNFCNGNFNAQYGILTSATSSGALAQMRIGYNTVQNSLFQGISMGGAVSNSTMFNNNVTISSGFQTVCYLVDLSDSLSPQFNSVIGNTSFGGTHGVFLANAFFTTISGNVCVGTSSDGYSYSATNGTAFSGNIAESCGGWGFVGTGTNTTFVGCQAISCVSGGYNVPGATVAGNI